MFECIKRKLKKKTTVTTPIEPDRKGPNDKGLLWYPEAKILEIGMKTQGNYEENYPQGAVVHFTAGNDSTEQNAIDSLHWGKSQKYAFMMIGPTGVVYQAHPLNEWGWHAGKSNWYSVGSSVSRYFVGIEVACAGSLDEDNESWFGEKYLEKDVRNIPEDTDNIKAGVYRKFTEAQETALIKLLVWLKVNNPLVFDCKNIVGHDEVSPGRKVDPGGSLSMSMPMLRHHVDMEAYKEMNGNYDTKGD